MTAIADVEGNAARIWRSSFQTELTVGVKVMYPTGQTWTNASGHVRQEVRGEERVTLAGLAVWPNARHDILHYEVAVAETQDTWATFLKHLLERGLDPNSLKLQKRGLGIGEQHNLLPPATVADGYPSVDIHP